VFFTLFSKNWRLLFDIILLVAVIIIIFLWNPFGLFGDGLQLRDTANLVSNVRSIGQLITSEYYGEVVASLDEAEFNLIDEDSLENKAHSHYVALKKLAFTNLDTAQLGQLDEKQVVKEKRKYNKIINTAFEKTLLDYESIYSTRTKEDTTDIILLFFSKYIASEKIELKKYKKGKNRDDLRSAEIENLLRYLARTFYFFPENKKQKADSLLNAGFAVAASYTDFHYDFLDLQKSKARQKKNLAMIGKGWVKAGFDFGTLDDRNFRYDSENKVIHLIGFEPTILDVDINPWFIPEQEVPGYTIIVNEKASFDDAIYLKTYCKRKLERYALEANILEQARTHGELVLKEFFSLLTGEEIVAVQFHADRFADVYTRISHDRVITNLEITMIDMAIAGQLRSISSAGTNSVYARQQREAMTTFIDDLKSLPLVVHNKKIEFNYFTKFLPEILADSVIDKDEYTLIGSELRWQPQNDGAFIPVDYLENRHWFGDSLSFMRDYNVFLLQLKRQSQHKNILYTLETKSEIISNDKLATTRARLDNELENNPNTLLNYTLVAFGDSSTTVHRTEIKGKSSLDLDSFRYNVQPLNAEVYDSFLKSDSFTVDVESAILICINEDSSDTISFRIDENLAESELQKNDLEAYHTLLARQYELYNNRSGIEKASQAVREKIFNREKLDKAGEKVRNSMSSIRGAIFR
jgi:hypothetical protein